MLKYYRTAKGSDLNEEITYEKALDIVLGSYRNNDMSRDMLTLPNRIPCQFSDVIVEDHKENGMVMVLKVGMYGALPDGIDYDDAGNRL